MDRFCRSNVSKSNRGGGSNRFCSGCGGGDTVLVIVVAMVVAATVTVRVASC